MQALSWVPGPHHVWPPGCHGARAGPVLRAARAPVPAASTGWQDSSIKGRYQGRAENHVRKQQIGASPGIRDVPGLNQCQLLWDVSRGGEQPLQRQHRTRQKPNQKWGQDGGFAGGMEVKQASWRRWPLAESSGRWSACLEYDPPVGPCPSASSTLLPHSYPYGGFYK